MIVASLQGRTGNQCVQFLFAYAFAQKYGLEFQCAEWIGERIFALPEYKRPSEGAVITRVNEITIFDIYAQDSRSKWDFEKECRAPLMDLEFRGYAQTQRAMIYTKRQAQSWLRLRPDIETACANAVLADDGKNDRVVCHRRAGDYIGYGYPVVSVPSYSSACEQFGLVCDSRNTTFLSEEDSTPHGGHLPDDLAFMADFYRLMMAPTLLRGNSSFSWLAALLGNGLVLSPVIDGLEGGKIHDCKFVAGNHPRLANFDFTTDLYVAP